MRSKKVNKNLIMMIIVLFITLGYAYLNSELKINGTTGIAGNTWDVHFENVVPSSSNTATVNVAPVANPIDKVTDLTYDITFNKPGDVYEFNVDIVNAGTIDAMIEELTSTIKIGSGEEIPVSLATLPTYLRYSITYEDGVRLANNHMLNANSTETITVHVEYKMDITEEELALSSGKHIQLKLATKYTQADDNAVIRVHYLDCTYEGELVNNAVYTNGQYTYTYNSSTDGWGVMLTDKDSTDPVTSKLCSTINGKPIVSMYGMFAGSKTTSIDTSSFNTSKVTDMSAMFYNVKFESIDVSSFNTENVTNMATMFFGNTELTDLDLSNFDTSNVTSMNVMFYGDSKLTNINLSSFRTPKLTDITAMFYDCSELTELDLSSFYTSKVTSMSGLMNGTSKLENIDFSNWDFRNSSIPISNLLYSGGNYIKKLNFSNAKFAGNMSNYFNGFYNLKSINMSNVDASSVTNMQSLFYGDTALKELNLNEIDTSNVTNMSRMFYNVKAENLDVSSLDTGKVTIMAEMFSGCSELTELDLSSFDISRVSQIDYFLKDTSNLRVIDFSNWDFSNLGVPLKNLLYSEGSMIQSLDFSNAKFGSDMSGYFINFTNLESINLDNVDTSSVTNMRTLFYNDTKLLELDLSDFDTSKVTSMEYMFYGTKFKELDLSSFDTSKVTVMSNIFNNMTDLEKLNLSGWDFSKIGHTFHEIVYHSSLKELDVSNAIFGENMKYGFYISSLESLNLSGVDTTRTVDFSMAFQQLKIPSLDISNLDMQNVTDASYMFYDSQIERIDLSASHFNRVERMMRFASSCTKLKYVNLNNGGSDNLSAIDDMFYGSGNIEEIYMKNFNFGTVSSLGSSQGPFYYKTKLSTVDLSGAKMINVDVFSMAFDSCYALNQIDLSNIIAPKPIRYTDQMFSYNYQLNDLDLSSFDLSQVGAAGNMFTNVPATTVYVKTQADVDNLNEKTPDRPSTLTFVVKP